MNKDQKSYEEDIDFIEMFLILWKGKWLIILFIFLGTLFSSSYFLYKNKYTQNEIKIYESSISFTVEPFFIYTNKNYNHTKTISDFQKLVNQKNIFLSWKENENNSYLSLDLLNNFVNYNDIIFSKDLGDRLISFSSDDGLNRILIKSENISIFPEIYKYVNFVSKNLTLSHLENIKNEYKKTLSIVNDYKNSNYPPPFQLILRQLELESFINEVQDGLTLIKIDYPSFPKILNPSGKFPYSMIAVIMVLSGIFGFLFVLIQNSIFKYNLKR